MNTYITCTCISVCISYFAHYDPRTGKLTNVLYYEMNIAIICLFPFQYFVISIYKIPDLSPPGFDVYIYTYSPCELVACTKGGPIDSYVSIQLDY